MTAAKRSAATSVYLPTGHRLGRYEVLVKLATGGMAVVYIGRAQGLAGFERLVALKVLHQNLAHEQDFVWMFLDEARLAARIRHPNVVPTIDISDTPETGFFIVMDYVEGDHLGALLSAAHRASTQLPLPVTLRIVADALGGLGAAHDLRDEKGELLRLVHRDVSPHNILVGVDGVARLTDFGVAKAENRLAHTRDGQLKGKLAYMAPEQATHGACDARSDLFAMGVILWEAVTGRRLFRADNPGATLTKLLHEPIALPSVIDPALAPLDAVVSKALDRDPDRRYQSADELIDALERVAPRLGGLASLREVSAVVRELTGEKLRRERELLELAKEALVLQQGGVIGREPTATDASHVTNHSDVSMASMSLSRSKVSGVFSNATATGLQIGVGPSLPPPLVPPPPAGALAPDSDWAKAPRKHLGWSRMLAVVAVLGLMALVWVIARWQPAPIASPLVLEVDPVPADAVMPAPVVEAQPSPPSVVVPTPAPAGSAVPMRTTQPLESAPAVAPAAARSTAEIRAPTSTAPAVGATPPRATPPRIETPARPASPARSAPPAGLGAGLDDTVLVNPYRSSSGAAP